MLIQEQMVRLLEQGRVQPVYMDFEDICTSPEMFAQRYVGLTAFWSLTAGEGEVDAYLTVERLLETAAARSPTLAQQAASPGPWRPTALARGLNKRQVEAVEVKKPV